MTTPYHYLQVLYFRGAKVRKLIGSHKVIVIYFKIFLPLRPFSTYWTLEREHSFRTLLRVIILRQGHLLSYWHIPSHLAYGR